MKIAYVTSYDSSDVHSWSGLGYYILQALQDSGFETEAVGGLREDKVFLRVKSALYNRLSAKDYHVERDPVLLKHYARQVEKSLETIQHDAVFSPGTIPIAFLKTKKPIVFWTDATFAGIRDFYPGFSNLCRETIRNGNRLEQQALTKCRLAIYSSEWAANTAVENYNVHPDKVRVVPFGANVNSSRDVRDINAIISSKSFDICKLVFIGVDWYRKGGDIALKVADQLNRRGVKTELHIAGCEPTFRLPAYVKQHGFISKSSAEGRQAFDKLMTDAHFFILPTRAECFGVVFAEASSYGLPSLATDVGGIPTAIRNGRNGQTFALSASVEEYCDYIERYMKSKSDYSILANSSFTEYSERLNWSSTGRMAHDLIKEYCG